MTLSAQDLPLVRGCEVDPHDITSFAGWFPVAVDAGEGCVWWRFMGKHQFTAAFFQDDLVMQPAAERLVCRTPVAVLPAIARGLDSVEPTAFVFHVSRCGSTLLTQMLAALPQTIAISEPPVLDGFFRLHHANPASSGGEHTLRALVRALGQRRTDAEARHLVVKFDSWHMPWLPWVRALFPGVPIVVLYRQPEEVLASHRRQPGWQVVPGLLSLPWLPVDLTDIRPADLDGYAAQVLTAIFTSARDAADGGLVTLVNYRQLPDVIWTALLPLFGVAPDSAGMKAIRTRAGFHSKQGSARFEGDVPAVPSGRQVVKAMPESLRLLYAQLEKKRLAP